jgi:putative hydrolase of the HAD superfamily
MPYRGVLFDVDGTLIGLRPEPEAFYLQVCQEYGLACSAEKMARSRAVALGFVNQHGLDYGDDEREMWRAANREVFLHLGAGEKAAECAARFQVLFSRGTEQFLFPDVMPTLAGLHARGYLLGALTGRLYSNEALLVQLGVRPYLAFYLYAGELGVLKPDPRMYREALARARLPAELVVLVGDQPADVDGARSVGITPVLLARQQAAAPGDVARVTDLRELLLWLRKPSAE